MILSEKITELRKRYGLSQEQLGEQIGVSRQAVSKWEMAQSVPDINKIIALAEYFGVSTDLLLKDDMELEAPFNGVVNIPAASTDNDGRMITLEEVSEYLAAREDAAKKISLVILLFCVSPFAGIILSGAGGERLGIIGAITEIIILAAAAVIIVPAINNMKRFGYMKDGGAELAYGVRGAAEERKTAFEHYHLLGIIIGIILLLCSVIPMMICSVFTQTNDIAIALCGCVMLLMIAAGTVCIVYVSYIYRGFKKVLKHR